MKNFAITGVAGYIAPRHLQAIRDTGNTLLAAVDPHDSVGILDRFFPQAAFFTEFERFDRYLDKLRRGPAESRIDYLSVCAPNHLHDAHIRLALRIGANAICEKPLVLKPWNLDGLQELERETGGHVSTILQLRLHPSLISLRERLSQAPRTDRKHTVCLTYITARGPWYHYSWKGSVERSGGIATNIGIHFFDVLLWLFGKAQWSEVHISDNKRMAGYLELENAHVKWFLSIDRNDLPEEELSAGKTTFRSIIVDNEELEFSDGFTDLHTKSYEEILAGRCFGIDDARPSIELVYNLTNSGASDEQDTLHPLIQRRAAQRA